MPVTYQSWLVLLSIVMAIQGAYVGLSLAVQIGSAAGMRRRLLLAGAAFSLAVAIWTMHFVGMLATRLPVQVDYLVFPTLLSFLVCVIVVGAAVYATSSGPLTLLRLTLSSCLMGGGIFSMHYIGMSALSASAYMIHDRYYVAASMAIAIAASGLALWLATGRGGRPPLVLSAIVLGIAVSGMHYTAMAGLTLLPFAAPTASAPALSSDLLATVVAVVAFCLSGIFLLILVPEPEKPLQSAALGETAASGEHVVTAGAPRQTAEMPVMAQAPHGNGLDANPEFGRGTYSPLGGIGAPPRRFARHLPIERDGSTISSPSRRWSRFTPTRITLISSMAATSCFARSPSATSNPVSTTLASCASTAAISSISTGWSAINAPATTNWSRWMRPMIMSCRSVGAGSAG